MFTPTTPITNTAGPATPPWTMTAPAPASAAAQATPPAPPVGAAGGKLPTLKPGQLRAQILAHLVDHRTDSNTAGHIARALGGRSTGAVGQALTRLGERGQIISSTGNGRREYEVTSDGLDQHRTNLASGVLTAGLAALQPTPTSPPPAAAAAPPVPSGPVLRPNGTPYHPRQIAGRRDIDVLQELRGAGIACLLYGPPGTGKTSVVEAAFGDELHTVAGDGDTTVGDLIGDYVPDGAGYRFVPGPLPTAMEAGEVLFIDDATLISPRVLAVVYPAMDGRRQIVLKADAGRLVTAADGFYVIAGHNPGVHGAVLTEALASRFATHIQVSTDYDLAHALGVNPRAVRAATELNAKVEAGEIGWAPQLRELIAFKKITDTLDLDTAIANLAGVAPVEDRDTVAAVLAQRFNRTTVTALALGKQL